MMCFISCVLYRVIKYYNTNMVLFISSYVMCSVPGGLKETKMFLPHPRVKVSIVGSLRDQEVACPASDRQGSISNPVSGGQCHLNHLTILRRFSWLSLAYVHKGGLKPDSFHLYHVFYIVL